MNAGRWHRGVVTVGLALVLAACNSDDEAPTIDAGSGLSPAPSGGGFCCPIDPITCNCFRHGGWVEADDLASCPQICDLAPPGTHMVADSHGCLHLEGPTSCL